MFKIQISSNNKDFAKKLFQSVTRSIVYQRALEKSLSIATDGSEVYNIIIQKQQDSYNGQFGFTLGMLKSYLDTTPLSVPNEIQPDSNAPLEYTIKKALHSKLKGKIDVRLFTDNEDLDSTNKKPLSQKATPKEQFEYYFDKSIQNFVLGFASGYYIGFNAIAKEEGFEEVTSDIVNDIINNSLYFFFKTSPNYNLNATNPKTRRIISELRTRDKVLFSSHQYNLDII